MTDANGHPRTTERDLWDRLEQAAKVLSLVAIPVVVGLTGWLIESAISKQNVNQQYVQLAVTILTKKTGEVDPGLWDWAVDLPERELPDEVQFRCRPSAQRWRAKPRSSVICRWRSIAGSRPRRINLRYRS